MHSPRPGEKYTISVEEAVAALLKGTTIRFRSPDMPVERSAVGTGKVIDGKVEIMVVGHK